MGVLHGNRVPIRDLDVGAYVTVDCPYHPWLLQPVPVANCEYFLHLTTGRERVLAGQDPLAPDEVSPHFRRYYDRWAARTPAKADKLEGDHAAFIRAARSIAADLKSLGRYDPAKARDPLTVYRSSFVAGRLLLSDGHHRAAIVGALGSLDDVLPVVEDTSAAERPDDFYDCHRAFADRACRAGDLVVVHMPELPDIRSARLGAPPADAPRALCEIEVEFDQQGVLERRFVPLDRVRLADRPEHLR